VPAAPSGIAPTPAPPLPTPAAADPAAPIPAGSLAASFGSLLHAQAKLATSANRVKRRVRAIPGACDHVALARPPPGEGAL